MAVNPFGVSTPSTGISWSSCGTGLSVGSHGQQTATTRAPAARYSSARSYHPPPRPRRNPSWSTARAGTMIRPAFFSASGPFALLPGSCGRCVLMDRRCWSGPADRECRQVRSSQYPCRIRAVAPARGNSNRIMLQHRHHRHFAAHGRECGHRGERMNEIRLPRLFGQLAAGFQSFLLTGLLSSCDCVCAPLLFQLTLVRGFVTDAVSHDVGLHVRGHTACCTTGWLRENGNVMRMAE